LTSFRRQVVFIFSRSFARDMIDRAMPS
jgi:hypothetical protein